MSLKSIGHMYKVKTWGERHSLSLNETIDVWYGGLLNAYMINKNAWEPSNIYFEGILLLSRNFEEIKEELKKYTKKMLIDIYNNKTIEKNNLIYIKEFIEGLKIESILNYDSFT